MDSLHLLLLPTTFAASVFIVALAGGIPVAILTASGVGAVNRAFYDVARTLGANDRFLVLKVAIPAALPNVFVGLFMGLYYSFAVLVVAEMLGAKYGLGWYIQFMTLLFGLCERLCRPDHHGGALLGDREAPVRRPRPAAVLAEGIL